MYPTKTAQHDGAEPVIPQCERVCRCNGSQTSVTEKVGWVVAISHAVPKIDTTELKNGIAPLGLPTDIGFAKAVDGGVSAAISRMDVVHTVRQDQPQSLANGCGVGQIERGTPQLAAIRLITLACIAECAFEKYLWCLVGGRYRPGCRPLQVQRVCLSIGRSEHRLRCRQHEPDGQRYECHVREAHGFSPVEIEEENHAETMCQEWPWQHSPTSAG